MTATTTKPRIYVACLSSYNEGRLHGKWIDCSSDVDEMHRDIQAMLADSPSSFAEEWDIHDVDGISSHFVLDNGLDGIAEVMQASADHDADAIAAYIDFFSDWDLEHFEKSYCFCVEYAWDKLALKSYAVEEFWELSGFNSTVQDELGSYIDEDKILREFENENTVVRWGEFYYVFRSC